MAFGMCEINKGNEILVHTMALIPPEDTNVAAASLDCRTAPSKSEGKQLKQKAKRKQLFDTHWNVYLTSSIYQLPVPI